MKNPPGPAGFLFLQGGVEHRARREFSQEFSQTAHFGVAGRT
jgi:hypothetical protein